MRPSGRAIDEMRQVEIVTDISMHAEGSCLVKFGNTQILCTASLDETVPPFLRGKGRGWVTAEYGMLPRSTGSRMKRESAAGKQTGRTQEIQRLISRSIRAVLDLEVLGERQILIDCDVLQADGGTRTASITGSYVALYIACRKLVKSGVVKKNPVINSVSAVSCGIYEGNAVLDLDYVEDSAAEVDANFVITGTGGLVEVQGTAERGTFSDEQLMTMLSLAKKASKQLTIIQNKALRIEDPIVFT
jgi:ribonuclease PH